MEKTNCVDESCDPWWERLTEWWLDRRNKAFSTEFELGSFVATAKAERYRGEYFKSIRLSNRFDDEPIGPVGEMGINTFCDAIFAYSAAQEWLDRF